MEKEKIKQLSQSYEAELSVGGFTSIFYSKCVGSCVLKEHIKINVFFL